MSIHNRTSCFFWRLKYHTNTTLHHHIKMRSHTSGTYAHSTLEHHMKMRLGTSGGFVDTSIWKKLDSRTFGITRSLIPLTTWTVLNNLHRGGFAAYLVGGCVRDLVLNRTPKDFDVVTNANLKQIKKLSQRAFIVGCRFPICKVHVRGSIIEVSSFDTVTGNATQKEEANFTRGHRGCGEEDFVRWRDCMRRDFTINSLLFDPFANIIYDYAGGMEDLKSLKLRTLVPAQLSFKEDCARILRGLRIAARLGLSFSEDTETAICSLSPSIMSLSKSRIMMELNYMLSYGAAGPSICLLQRFNLLELLLPLQATYLAQQPGKETAKCSTMLMKLFSNLDKLLHCNRPSDCILWLGLLAFHQALVTKPQDALVICTFSSFLHRGGWAAGVKFAREHAEAHVSFEPEVLEVCHHKSDEELAEEIMQLASLVNNSINALTGTQIISKSVFGYQSFPHPDLVFVSKKMAKNVARIFQVMLNDIESYEEQRKSLDIDYGLLGKGDPSETRFVIGKIIVDTMTGEEVIQGITNTAEGQRQHQKEVSPVLQQLGEDNNRHIDVFNPLKNAVDVKEFGKPTVSAESVPKHKEAKVSGVEAKEIGQRAQSSPSAIRKLKKKQEKGIKNGSKRVRKCGLSQSSAAVPDFTEKKIVTSGLKIEEDEKESLTPSSAVPKQKNGGKVDVRDFGKSTVSADAVPKHKKPKVSGVEAKEIGQRAHSSPRAIPKHKKPKVSGVEAKEIGQCVHSSPSAIPKHKKPKVSGVEAKEIGQRTHSSPSAIPKHKKPKISGVEAKEIGQRAHSSPSAIPKHKKPKVSGVEAKEIGQGAHSSPSAMPKHKKPNGSVVEAKEIGQCAHSSPSAIPKHKKKQESGVKNARKRVRKRGLSHSSAHVPDITEKNMVTSGLKIDDETESLTPSIAYPKQKNAGKVDEGGQGGTISPSIGVRKGRKQDLSKNITQDADECDLPKKTKSKGGPALLFSLFR